MQIKHSLPTSLIAGGALLAAATFTLQSGSNKPFPVPSYSVLRVIDGDTFETTEKQLIRLASVNSPELQHCGGPEAKTALETKILNHPVYLKVLYRDPFYRLISLVYTDQGYVNEAMVREGYGAYHLTGTSDGNTLLVAAQEARSAKRGIYGKECTQTENTTKPSCSIKANVNQENIYYSPDCFQYKNTVVELYKGDQWFCTEAQAQKAGFRKAKQCN